MRVRTSLAAMVMIGAPARPGGPDSRAKIRWRT